MSKKEKRDGERDNDEDIRETFIKECILLLYRITGIDAFIGTPSDQYHRLSRPIHVQPSLLDNIHAFSTSRFYRYIFLTSLFQSPSFALLMDIMKNCGEVCEVS